MRREAAARGTQPVQVREVQSCPGEGIAGVDDTGPIRAGNRRMPALMAGDMTKLAAPCRGAWRG